MGICSWVVFGFVVGLIARAVMPGSQNMGIIATTLLGIAGSFTGGFLANLLGRGAMFEFRATSWIGSIIGALILLAVGQAISRNRARSG